MSTVLLHFVEDGVDDVEGGVMKLNRQNNLSCPEADPCEGLRGTGADGMVSVYLKAVKRGMRCAQCQERVPTLLPTYGYDTMIGEMWGASDLVEWLIFISLVLMLGYSAFVVIRFSRRFYTARRELRALASDSSGTSEGNQGRLVAELSRGIATLKSIASAAPFLGLAGTSYGILAALFRGYASSRGSILAMMSEEVATALVTTIAGLLVATPAALSYNILRTCLEKLECRRSNVLLGAASATFQVAQTLPLRERFSGFPAFALIGAPILAILVLMFALADTQISTGLPVYLLNGVGDCVSDAIIISVIATNGRGRPLLYVNSKETSREELGNALRTQLHVRPRRMVYVEGGDDVEWAYVADAIDVARGLYAEVVLLTATPNIESSHASAEKTKRAKAQ